MPSLDKALQVVGLQACVHAAVVGLLVLSPIGRAWGVWAVIIGPFVGAWVASLRLRRRLGPMPRPEVKALSLVSGCVHGVAGAALAVVAATMGGAMPSSGGVLVSAGAVGTLLGLLALVLTLCGIDAGNLVRPSHPRQ